MSVRECLRVMRCLHLALATILARITGFREDIIPLFGFWAWGGFPGIGTHPVKCFLENRRFFCNDFFHNDQVNANFCLRIRPMLVSLTDGRQKGL